MKTFSMVPRSEEVRAHVRCIVCGGDDPRPHWTCDGFSFVRCRRCGHVYQDPQPAARDLIDRYDREYLDYEVENDRNFLDLMIRGLRDVRFFERFSGRPGPSSFLDVGCATGALLEYARERGFAVHGVEVCEPAARYGTERRGVPILVGTLGTVDLPHRFSAIHFSHVIEHVSDPRQFLLRVREAMEPDGLGVVVTPNTSGLQARLFGAEWRSVIADHVHLFSAGNLARLLQETGFSIIARKTWGGFGVGTVPRWVKQPMDRLAKVFGFGDVVLILFAPDGRKARELGG